ncbi:hypothetical protein BDW02DRAFT_574065 [Decorospora gaudefroyi]|uniref:Uncharacterized protein n=1 Tax=Decorospora gaudefroyi TaxID=184978 RepID=A0A6A5JYF2_9PLEO|nr:hypothetical protein BDW02DRAFT_574065 [Decorospora gaudefroyi]
MASWKAPKPIAKGLSVPANTRTISLLDRPGEIRNAVNDILFKFNDSIELTLRLDTTGHPFFVDKHIQKQILLGVPLLSTCRQIYHEATTILMSGNTWVVSKHATISYDPILYGGLVRTAAIAGNWMYSLGSHIDMLSTVRIQLDPELDQCLSSFEWHSGVNLRIQFGPLVKVLWAKPYCRLDIAFVDGTCCALQDHHPGNDHTQRQTAFKLQALNTLIATFRQNPLNTKRYSSQIQDIIVRRDCRGGYINSRYPACTIDRFQKEHFRNFHTDHFQIANEGATMAFQSTNRNQPHGIPPA